MPELTEERVWWRGMLLLFLLIVFGISACTVHDGLFMAHGFNRVVVPGKTDPIWTKGQDNGYYSETNPCNTGD